MLLKNFSECVQNESRFELAIKAYNNGQFKRILAAAKAYNIKKLIFRH